MIKNIKKKCIVSIAIIGLIVLFLLLNTWQEFLTMIIVALIGVLIPQLFDVTSIILNKINDMNQILNPERYAKTFKIYNDRLTNFAANFYFFIAEILIEEQKEYLKIPSHRDFSATVVADAFKGLLKHGQPTFKRIVKDGKQVFSDESCNRFELAQGELCDISRILQSLPQELEFCTKRIPEFINLQSAFYQVKGTFKYNAESRACEAFTEAFLKDLIKFLTIN